MRSDVLKIIDQALRLPPEARAAIAGSLIESLDGTLDENAEAAWETEVARRVQELDRGERKTIPWSEARKIVAG